MKIKPLILLVTLVLSSFVLVGITLSDFPPEPTGTYSPWGDLNDDGIINIFDIVWLTGRYQKTGTPVNKTALLYNMSDTLAALNTQLGDLESELGALQSRLDELETANEGFVNAPAYDSGWINITDKAGQYFNITHGLNSTDIIVDTTGKTTLDEGTHQRNRDLTNRLPGWSQTYGGTSGDYARALVETSDGGYALAGEIGSFGPSDFWLVKTDASGNMQWNQTYGGIGIDYALSLVQTVDGGYAIAGFADSFGAGSLDFWLVKTDVEQGLAWTDSATNSITLYRGVTDAYWNFVRVRIWKIKDTP